MSLTRPGQGIATLTRPGGDTAWSTVSQGTTHRAVASDIYRSTLANTGGVGTAGSYGPYGQPQGTPTTGSVTLGYRGEVVIGGLTYLRARDYDPTSGTFTTTDPVPGFPGAAAANNPYAYVNNNPINTTDPTGQFAPPGFTAGLWGSVDNGALGGFGQTVSSLWNNRTVYRAVLATGASKAAGWVTDHKETIAATVISVAAGAACTGLTLGTATVGCVLLSSAIGGAVYGGLTHCGNGNSATQCATGVLTEATIWTATGLAFYGAGRIINTAGRAVFTRIATSETVTALTSKTASRLAQRGQTGAIRLGGKATTNALEETTPSGIRPDFVAGPVGSAPPVPVSQSRMAAGLDAAGLPRTPTASAGMEYTLSDGTLVRLMRPAGNAPLRASFTNAKGGPINPFTGKPVQPPAPPGWSMKHWVRSLTHVEQTP